MLLCDICDKPLSSIQTFRKHKRVDHGYKGAYFSEFDYSKYSAKCNECKVSFRYTYGLRAHLTEKHNFDGVAKYFFFKHENEFLQWKIDEEKKNAVRFTISPASACDYYYCNRSVDHSARQRFLKDGTFLRQRKLKKSGSIKLQYACTGQFIKFVDDSGLITVKYFSSHYGHSTEPQETPYTEKELIKKNKKQISSKKRRLHLQMDLYLNKINEMCTNLKTLEGNDENFAILQQNIQYLKSAAESLNDGKVNSEVSSEGVENINPLVLPNVENKINQKIKTEKINYEEVMCINYGNLDHSYI